MSTDDKAAIRTDATLSTIISRLGGMSLDEIRVVAQVIDRLLLGRQRYGALDLAADPRDWRVELTEELLDVLVYRAIVTLRKELICGWMP